MTAATGVNESTSEKRRSYHLLTTYGITAEQYDALLAAQGGKCAVCPRPPANRRLSVDHDHITLLVRGLLCTRCNVRLIGREREPDLFTAAALYLSAPPAVAVIGLHRVPRNPPKRRRTRRKKAA